MFNWHETTITHSHRHVPALGLIVIPFQSAFVLKLSLCGCCELSGETTHIYLIVFDMDCTQVLPQERHER